MNDATEVFQPLQADDPRTVAGYRLAARLGAGGMGRVYLSHTQGGRPVAIKVVRPELADDPAFRRRFGREIKAAQRVRGAYTAELIDADADGVPPWLATLYVPGPSLAEAVARRGPLPVPAVLWLMAGVAEALQAIHGAGIVHRDLKPSNVLLATDGPRVIDFGISLAADATWHTATGSAVGTPQFMAPEQATAGEVTPATDMFALGQTAAFAALGEPLYGDGPSATVLYRIVHSEPELSLLPEQLRPLIARCLAAAPEQRATPAEVIEWCRQRLGRDADAGGGPAVWREVAGTEVTVPAPVPDPTRTHTVPAGHTGPDRTRPLLAQPHLQTRPTAPGDPSARRRRTALTVAAVVVGLALLTGLTLWLKNLPSTPDHRDAAASSTPGGQTSGAARPPASASPADDDGSGSGSGGGTAKESDPSPTAARTPQAEPYPQQWIDEKTSLSFKEPISRKDRKGDILFDCKKVGCELQSDTSVMALVYDKPGTTLDDCRFMLTAAHSHNLPLAAAANGSEICVKNRSGDIALLVIQTKSTALWDKPGISFMTADMTIWRKAA
jgi:serine/threonine protein kinase